jgi:hypothetical protein
MKEYLKIYKKALNDKNFDNEELLLFIGKAIKNKDYESVYFLSRAIYSKAKEETKIKLSNHLMKHGLEKIIPFQYIKMLNENAELSLHEDFY